MNTNHSVSALAAGKQNISVSDERDLGAFIPSFLDDFGLDVYQFRVYCRLARRAGAGGQCWESVNNIANACNMNRKTVMSAIASLLKFCLIRQTKRPGKSDLYQLTHHRHWISPTNIPQGSPASSLQEPKVTSPSDGLVQDEAPVPGTDTTSPPQGQHQSAMGTTPVPGTDTKVFPQGSPTSSSQELVVECWGAEASVPQTLGETNNPAAITHPPCKEGGAMAVSNTNHQLEERIALLRTQNIECGTYQQGLETLVAVNGFSMSIPEFMQRSPESFKPISAVCKGQLEARALVARMKSKLPVPQPYP